MILPLPYEELMYRTPLSATEIHQKLAEVVETKSIIWPASTPLPYQGKIGGEGGKFEIRRVIRYRNSFNPTINGTILITPEGFRIHLIMRLHMAVMIFMVAWLGSTTMMFVGMLVSAIFAPPILLGLIFPLGMFIFGYLLCTLAFKYEANQSKLFLQELFQAELITEESA